MTGRKAGVLWKATVDEKESGWRGWEGWLSLFLLCFFVAPVPCIFFEKVLGQVAVSSLILLISGLRAELILGFRHVVCMIAF